MRKLSHFVYYNTRFVKLQKNEGKKYKKTGLKIEKNYGFFLAESGFGAATPKNRLQRVHGMPVFNKKGQETRENVFLARERYIILQRKQQKTTEAR